MVFYGQPFQYDQNQAQFIDFELRRAANELEKIVAAFEELVTDKERIDIVEKLKKANARVQGIKYLSKKI